MWEPEKLKKPKEFAAFKLLQQKRIQKYTLECFQPFQCRRRSPVFREKHRDRFGSEIHETQNVLEL
jgi:hypothetical protein